MRSNNGLKIYCKLVETSLDLDSSSGSVTFTSPLTFSLMCDIKEVEYILQFLKFFNFNKTYPLEIK